MPASCQIKMIVMLSKNLTSLAEFLFNPNSGCWHCIIVPGCSGQTVWVGRAIDLDYIRLELSMGSTK